MTGMKLRIFLGALLAGGLGIWIFGERGQLIRPSSWKGLRAVGLRSLLNFNAVHQYVYGRWTNQYIKVLIFQIFPRLSARRRQHWVEHYHAKVLTHEQAEAIVHLDHDLPLRDLEKIIPYPLARDLVLKGPPDVAAYECACRHARPNPCQPTQVCMVIGQPFVDFTLEHNPGSSRRLTQAEAVDLLKAEHDRGHLHSAWFKDACLDRFYVICNCCKCCCGSIEAMVKYGSPFFASSGYVAQVDEARCSACGACVEACPFGALSQNGALLVNWDQCMGCGVCASQCATDGISLVRDELKGIPLDVRVMV